MHPYKERNKTKRVKVMLRKEKTRETWVGFRPSVIENKRKNNKKNRKEARKKTKDLCVQYNNR